MAGILRATAQLFGFSGLTGTGGFGAAAAGTVTTEAASSNTLSNIQEGTATAWADGWLAAVLGSSKFPAIEDMNAVDYTFSTQIAYLLERGIPEYDAGTTYNTNDICRAVGGLSLYASVGNANTGNALSNATYWTSLGNLGNLSGSLPFTNTAGTNVAYSATQSATVLGRNNSGTAMVDTLPGTSGALANGEYFYLTNTDGSGASLSVQVGAGGSIFQGTTSGTVVIEPGEMCLVLSQGAGSYLVNRVSTPVLHSAPPQGDFKNLKIVTTSVTVSVITADAMIVQDANGNTRRITGINSGYATGTSGASGLDTGTIAASTWYYEYIIYNPTANAQRALISLSASAPTLPSGYTYFARVGAIKTDGSANLWFKTQYNRRAEYTIGTNPTALPQIVNGPAGNPTTPTWIGASVSPFVPPTASSILISMFFLNSSTASDNIVAPNNSYGAWGSTSNPAPLAGTTNVTVGGGQSIPAEFTLESTNIYYAAGSPDFVISCLGYTDNL